MSQPSENSSAFWMPAAAVRRPGQRKVRPEAVLKNLLRPAQERIAEWAEKPADRDADGNPVPGTGGRFFALAQLAATAAATGRPELAVGKSVLYAFLDWFSLEQDLDASFAVEEQVFAKTGDRKKAREAGETLLMRLGIASRNPKLLTAAMMGEDSRRNLDLQEETGKTKAQQKNRQLDQGEKRLAHEREKFKASIRTKVEAGLAEIAEQVKGNTAAEAALAKLQVAISA